MTLPPPPPDRRPAMPPDPDDGDALFATLAAHLPQPGPRAPEALRQRLLGRVARSAAAQRAQHTVRRETGAWQAAGPGVAQRLLRCSGGMRVSLLQLQPGTALPWFDDAPAQEVLLLQGALAERHDAASAPALAAHGHLVRTQPGAGWHSGDGPALLYLRERLASAEPLPALEARWWQLAGDGQRVVPAESRPWTISRPGVSVRALCGDRQVVSMLVRFAPGASVPDHHHDLDEDCLMLSGEMYLGDTLLRPLDYQLAPAGGGHTGEMSEAGGTFFFHGALDPVLLAPA